MRNRHAGTPERNAVTQKEPSVSHVRSLVIAATVCAALAMAPQCGQPVRRMVLSPAEPIVSIGESFVLTVETRNLAVQTGFSLALSYDPALLALDGPIDLMHGAGGLSIVPTPLPGLVEIQAAEVTGLPDETGTGLLLARIPFRALAAGTAVVDFDSGWTARAVPPPAGGPAVEAVRIDPVKTGASVTIQ